MHKTMCMAQSAKRDPAHSVARVLFRTLCQPLALSWALLFNWGYNPTLDKQHDPFWVRLIKGSLLFLSDFTVTSKSNISTGTKVHFIADIQVRLAMRLYYIFMV